MNKITKLIIFQLIMLIGWITVLSLGKEYIIVSLVMAVVNIISLYFLFKNIEIIIRNLINRKKELEITNKQTTDEIINSVNSLKDSITQTIIESNKYSADIITNTLNSNNTNTNECIKQSSNDIVNLVSTEFDKIQILNKESYDRIIQSLNEDVENLKRAFKEGILESTNKLESSYENNFNNLIISNRKDGESLKDCITLGVQVLNDEINRNSNNVLDISKSSFEKLSEKVIDKISNIDTNNESRFERIKEIENLGYQKIEELTNKNVNAISLILSDTNEKMEAFKLLTKNSNSEIKESIINGFEDCKVVSKEISENEMKHYDEISEIQSAYFKESLDTIISNEIRSLNNNDEIRMLNLQASIKENVEGINQVIKYNCDSLVTNIEYSNVRLEELNKINNDHIIMLKDSLEKSAVESTHSLTEILKSKVDDINQAIKNNCDNISINTEHCNIKLEELKNTSNSLIILLKDSIENNIVQSTQLLRETSLNNVSDLMRSIEFNRNSLEERIIQSFDDLTVIVSNSTDELCKDNKFNIQDIKSTIINSISDIQVNATNNIEKTISLLNKEFSMLKLDRINGFNSINESIFNLGCNSKENLENIILTNSNNIVNTLEKNKIQVKEVIEVSRAEIKDLILETNVKDQITNEGLIKNIGNTLATELREIKENNSVKLNHIAELVSKQSDVVISNSNANVTNIVQTLNTLQINNIENLKSIVSEIRNLKQNYEKSYSVNKITQSIKQEVAVTEEIDSNEKRVVEDATGKKLFKGNKLIGYKSNDGLITEFKYKGETLSESITKKDNRVITQCYYKDEVLNEAKHYVDGKLHEVYFYYPSQQLKKVTSYHKNNTKTIEYYENGKIKKSY